MSSRNLTDESYWSSLWQHDVPLPKPVDPSDKRPANTVVLTWDKFFRKALKDVGPGASFLEIGCAQSRWLPYFHNELGFDVAGLDYSEVGCVKARRMLEAAGVSGEVHHADMFKAPAMLQGKFDVVASFGVIEHFKDTAECLEVCASFLKPGGILLTTIPNMRGSIGWLQQNLDETTYDIHVPLGPDDLATAHAEASLDLKHCDYLMSANWGVVALPRMRGLPRRALKVMLKGATRLVWQFERLGVSLPSNRLTSPYIACVGVRTEDGGLAVS
ncbi:MAG: class I SAM-dependent methyltransferase [Geminicoccaceae bacterium]